MDQEIENFYQLLNSSDTASLSDVMFDVYDCKTKEKKSIQYVAVLRKIKAIRCIIEEDFKLEETDNIAIVCQVSENTTACILAALCSNLVITFLEPDLSTEEMIEILKTTDSKAVFFPDSINTKIIEIIAPLPEVKHWVITSEKGRGLVPEMKVIDSLINGVDLSTKLITPEIYDDEESVIYINERTGRFPIGCAFSQKHIIAMAKAYKDLYKDFEPSLNHGIYLSEHSLNSIILCFFAPLFSKNKITFLTNSDVEKFWEDIKNVGVASCLIEFKTTRYINKRLKAKDHNMNDDFTFIMISEELIPERELSTFSQALKTSVITCLARAECGGLLTYEKHNPGEIITSNDFVSFGKAISGVTIEIASGSGDVLENGNKGLIKVASDRIMLSYAGTKPGKDLHISQDILLTEVEGFIEETLDNKLIVVEKGSVVIRNTPREIPTAPVFENEEEVVEEIEKEQPELLEDGQYEYEYADIDTDYGKICISEIMNLASHVNDAESLLKGAIASLIFHTEFERGLAIEIFRDQRRFTVLANEGFEFMVDSDIQIEDKDSLFLKAHGLQNSFSTRQNKNSPFDVRNYAFSYLPTQNRGIVAIYADLPTCKIMPFGERRVFRKVTSVLSILLQKFSFRYIN